MGVGAATALTLAVFAFAAAATPTAPAPIGQACLTKGERSHTPRFHSGSGVEIGGVLLGHGRGGVVLVHESPGDLCQWMFYARVLERRGFAVLPIDLNGFGSSLPAPGSPVRPHWDRDVAAAAGVLRAHGVRRVVLIGASLGGTAVMAAAADIQPRVAGVVDLSGPADSSGLDAVAAARRLRIPALYEVAEDDAYIAEVRKVYRATPPQLRKLIVVPGAGHGVGLLREDLQPHAAQDSAAIIAFIRATAAA